MTIKRGEIYWVDFDPIKGSEQGGLRPALVIQNDIGNRHSLTTVVAAITKTMPPRPFPFVVVIDPAESGLSEMSAVNCSQIATIHQRGSRSRFRPPRGQPKVSPIGRLKPKTMALVDRALKYSLELR